MSQDNRPFRLELDANQVATLTLQPGAGRLSPWQAEELAEIVDTALAAAELRGLIICSAKADFCQGTDIEQLTQQTAAAPLLDAVMRWSAAVRRLEAAGAPVVALLGGLVSGIGLELALAAHHRVAYESEELRLGLPDLALGLIPCAGAGQRLCRLLGMSRAVDLVLRGRLLGAGQARRAGLVDALCADRAAARKAAEEWIAGHPASHQPWDRPDYRFPQPRPGTRAAADLFIGAAAALYDKTAGALEGPKLALSALQEGAGLDFERSLELEARYFVRSALSAQAVDMTRTLRTHKRAAAQGEGLPSCEAYTGARKVAILGAGMMGADLAFVAARVGCDVALRDVSPSALGRAHERLGQLLKRERLATTDAEALLGRIRPTLELADVEGVDLLIEAVFENLPLKQQLLRETEPLLAEGGIWASNTSALPICEIAKEATQPGRVLGLHFFSPANRMELVEVIQGSLTEERVVGAALGFCRQLGKLPILVNDGYGFYTTRVFAAYVLEGIGLLAEGVAPAQIEWQARAAGMLVGPLLVADEVSLELVQHIVEQRRQYGRAYPAPRAERLLGQMIEGERLGRAAGAGFYDYADGRRAGLWSGLSALVAEPAVDSTALVSVGERLLLAQAVEASRTLDEGIIERRRDAELGAVLGVGFAPSTGGPLSYLDRVGLRWAVDRLEQLARTEARFEPPALLRRMAAEGERFFPVAQRTQPA